MTRFVGAVWAGTLAVAVAGVVPAAVIRLQRIVNAAHQIEGYTAEIRDATEGIARHTASITALADTIAAAGPLLTGAESLERRTALIQVALASARAGTVEESDA